MKPWICWFWPFCDFELSYCYGRSWSYKHPWNSALLQLPKDQQSAWKSHRSMDWLKGKSGNHRFPLWNISVSCNLSLKPIHWIEEAKKKKHMKLSGCVWKWGIWAVVAMFIGGMMMNHCSEAKLIHAATKVNVTNLKNDLIWRIWPHQAISNPLLHVCIISTKLSVPSPSFVVFSS